MNILCINLTRFGDLLQSAAALRSLARGDANRVGLVCLDNFVGGAELLPGVDAVYPFAAGKVMAKMHGQGIELDGKKPWMHGLSDLYDWAAKVREHFSPDHVCNLSPTLSACLLGQLLAGDAALSGFALDGRGHLRNTTPWATFMQGSSASRASSPFNVVDLFRRIAGDMGTAPDNALMPAPVEAVAAMRDVLRASSPEKIAGYVALQLGASAPVRQWPVASFAETGDTLWASHRLVPLLLGSKTEAPLGEEYTKKTNAPFVNLIGKTDITELAAALSLSSALISNDTGTLHLGSGVGIPVLGIYLATAQVCDTGPYSLDSCALEPDMPCHPCEFGTPCASGNACRSAITPETVIGLVSARLDTKTWPEPAKSAAFAASGSRIWKTTRDEHGFADLISLSGHDSDPRARWLGLQRHMYRQFFDDNMPGSFTPTPFPGHAVPGDLGSFIATHCDTLAALFDACIVQAGMVLSSPIPQLRERFSRAWERLNAAMAAPPAFVAISFVWRNESLAADGIEHLLPVMQRDRDLFSAIRATLP